MKVIPLKPHKTTHTKTETMLITTDVIASWKAPPFQRPLRVNEKVRTLSETIRTDGGVIPGVITLGVLGRDTYLIDGQHRAHAFSLSGLDEGYCDVRVHYFSDMGEMGEEFVNLNSRLVVFRPDDILRGLEESNEHLRMIRQRCEFVGYDFIRRGANSPVLSMSALLRCWDGSAPETPSSGSRTGPQCANDLTKDDTELLCSTTKMLEQAWGRDPAYFRLWGALNLTLCFWLFRRTVIGQHAAATTKITRELFKKLMMSVSADGSYTDWLVGRQLGDRDRPPAYARLKLIVARRHEQETDIKPRLPSPPWSKGHAG